MNIKAILHGTAFIICLVSAIGADDSFIELLFAFVGSLMLTMTLREIKNEN